jgi:hypothetical protein
VGGVAVTIVLADGFDGEDVELTVDGRTHTLKSARTSALTGMADELVVETGPVRVSARLIAPGAAPTAYDVPAGATLVLDRAGDGLAGRVHAGPVGFG